MANRVLCATLSIPLPPSRFSIDQLLESNESEKKRHLAFLLNLPSPPTRASLVKDLVGVCLAIINNILREPLYDQHTIPLGVPVTLGRRSTILCVVEQYYGCVNKEKYGHTILITN